MAVPFSVQCVSCHSRLRVNDESIVGTIVACPKCNSMVQIAAPDSPDPATSTRRTPPPPNTRTPMVAGDENVDSQEITQGEFSGIDDFEPAGQPVTPPPMAGTPSSNQPASSEIVTDGDDVLTEDLPWTTAPNRDSRQKLLIGATALGLLSSLSILAFWLLRDPTVTPTARVVAEDKSDAPAAVDLSTSDVPETSEPVSTNQDLAKQDPADEPPFLPVSSKIQPTETITPSETIEPRETDVPSSMIPEGLLPVDPLRGPASLDAGRENPGGQGPAIDRATEDQPAAKPLFHLPPELEAFTRLLDVPGNAPDQPPTRPAVENIEELQVERAADVLIDPMMLATPPPQVNVANALTLRVAISSKGYPLSDFVLVSSEVTQIPIQIDWVTLDLAGISVSQRVIDFKPGLNPIGDRLKRIAAEAEITLEQNPNDLLLTLSIEQYKTRLKDVLATTDFGNDQPSADELVAAFLKPIQWNERDQLGLQALVTESIRKARELPAKLNPLAIHHWTVAANYLSGAPIKGDYPEHWPVIDGGQSGAQLDTAITLAGFLRRTARLNNSTCLVNWQDAKDHRLSPGQLVMPFAGDPAGTMLRKNLKPLGLNARQASEGVWWVGTDATYDRMPLLVIGDPLGPKRDDILTRIRQAAQKAGTTVFLQHDPVSDRYLSLMPRFLYRQLPTILKPFR